MDDAGPLAIAIIGTGSTPRERAAVSGPPWVTAARAEARRRGWDSPRAGHDANAGSQLIRAGWRQDPLKARQARQLASRVTPTAMKGISRAT
jgi:hypothetical protein